MPDDSDQTVTAPRAKRSWRLGTADDLYRHLASYDRAPIIGELARWLDNGPTEEAIARLADNAPHKWAASLKTLGTLAGFAERSESIGVTAIVDMSDSQLATALRAKLDSLGIAMPLLSSQPIDAVAETVDMSGHVAEPIDPIE